MKEYTTLLSKMMVAILSGETKLAAGQFREREDVSISKQLAVYTDAYQIRLHGLLLGAYPALAHFMDKELFHTLAGKYISEHPSRYFNIDRYPLAFGQYVTLHSKDGIVKDIARLESKVAEVYMGPESDPVSMGWAAGQTHESLGAAKLKPRSASALLSFQYLVNDYARLVRAEKHPSTPPSQKNWLLIYRHEHQVQRLVLSEGEYILLSLLDGKTALADALGDARFTPYSEKALHSGEFMQWFARWTHKGCLCQTT